MKVAISGKLFEKYAFTEAARICGEIGYTGLEIRTCPGHARLDMSEAELQEFRRALEQHRLVATCLDTFTGDYSRLPQAACEEEFRQFVSWCRIAEGLGAAAVRHWAGWEPSYGVTEEAWQRSIRWMQRAAEAAQGSGLQVALEVHHETLLDNAGAARRYLEAVARPNLTLLLDPENWYYNEQDHGPESVKALAAWIGGIHCKNIVRATDQLVGSHSYLGSLPKAIADSYASRTDPAFLNLRDKRFSRRRLEEGAISYPAILQALKQIGFEGFVTVETSDFLGDAPGQSHLIPPRSFPGRNCPNPLS